VRSLKGFFEVVVELFIREVSGLETTSDQVCSRTWLRLEFVEQCPESAADRVALHRVSDLSTDRVGHIDRLFARGVRYEAESQRPALTTSSRCRQERELPAGSDPAGHSD
jgi:hypothetical protein